MIRWITIRMLRSIGIKIDYLDDGRLIVDLGERAQVRSFGGLKNVS